MRKVMYGLLTAVFFLFLSGQTVLADAAFDFFPNQTVTDYTVIVSAPDGGVNFRYGPGVEYDQIINEMIPNGVTLHVVQEAQASNGNYWGYVEYSSYYGWIALTQVTVIDSSTSSNSSQLYQGGSAVDYNVSVSAPDGGVNLRFGPGTEYDIRVSMIPNSVTLYVSAEAAASTGRMWGYTNYNGTEGWIALSQVTQLDATPTTAPPAETVTPTPAPTSAATAQPTIAPTQATPSQAAASITPSITPQKDGVTLSYAMITKLLVVLVIILILALAALVILYTRHKK